MLKKMSAFDIDIYLIWFDHIFIVFLLCTVEIGHKFWNLDLPLLKQIKSWYNIVIDYITYRSQWNKY